MTKMHFSLKTTSATIKNLVSVIGCKKITIRFEILVNGSNCELIFSFGGPFGLYKSRKPCSRVRKQHLVPTNIFLDLRRQKIIGRFKMNVRASKWEFTLSK